MMMMLVSKPQAVEPVDTDDLEWRQMMVREWGALSPDLKLFCWFDYLDDIDGDQPTVNDHHIILQPLYHRLVALGVVGEVLMRCKALMSVLLAHAHANA